MSSAELWWRLRQSVNEMKRPVSHPETHSTCYFYEYSFSNIWDSVHCLLFSYLFFWFLWLRVSLRSEGMSNSWSERVAEFKSRLMSNETDSHSIPRPAAFHQEVPEPPEERCVVLLYPLAWSPAHPELNLESSVGWASHGQLPSSLCCDTQTVPSGPKVLSLQLSTPEFEKHLSFWSSGIEYAVISSIHSISNLSEDENYPCPALY